MGFLFFNLVHVPFHPLSVGWLVLLPCHCIVSAMISFTLVFFVITFGIAGWNACHTNFSYYSFFSPYCLAFLLGQCIQHHRVPRPISFFGHPWPISFFPTFYILVFAKSFGFPWSNYHILCLWVYWPSNQSHLLIPFFGLLRSVFAFFPFLTIPMNLLLYFLGLPRSVYFLWGHLLFCGHVDHYSCHSGTMIFTLLLSFSTFFILLGFFSRWTLFVKKWASTTRWTSTNDWFDHSQSLASDKFGP